MNSNKYDDMIYLPNPTPTSRPRMSLYERATQFSPFAALTGYEDAVEETARLTDARLELSEDMKTILNEKMQMIVDNMDADPIGRSPILFRIRKRRAALTLTLRASSRRSTSMSGAS